MRVNEFTIQCIENGSEIAADLQLQLTVLKYISTDNKLKKTTFQPEPLSNPRLPVFRCLHSPVRQNGRRKGSQNQNQ